MGITISSFVFVGENGSGKRMFLEAMDIAIISFVLKNLYFILETEVFPYKSG